MSEIIIDTQEKLDKAVSQLKQLNLGRVWKLTVVQYRKRSKGKKEQDRSVKQNKVYWRWLTQLMDHTGHFKDEIHEEFRDEFCPEKPIKTIMGEWKKVKSTTLLNTVEFNKYLEDIYYFSEMRIGYALEWPEDLGILTQRNG